MKEIKDLESDLSQLDQKITNANTEYQKAEEEARKAKKELDEKEAKKDELFQKVIDLQNKIPHNEFLKIDTEAHNYLRKTVVPARANSTIKKMLKIIKKQLRKN
ncbi:hypothetical protein [Mycoplasmopsis cynos]|uniref:hypothetical protein n=1 Tax=Mycoplasmopsis cynos TaxID=171284 RepID=UPI002FEF1580